MKNKGNLSNKWSYVIYRVCKLIKLPSWVGIGPESWLFWNHLFFGKEKKRKKERKKALKEKEIEEKNKLFNNYLRFTFVSTLISFLTQ